MTREDVIRGLECCMILGEGGCDDCPYIGKGQCQELLGENAIALLKEQEPVAPVLQSGGNYVCGNCGMYTVGFQHPITGQSVKTWKYCGKCGKKVRWDG